MTTAERLRELDDRPVSEPVHIISLGAGVQSSRLALGEGSETLVEAAVFADTQSEPENVYRYLSFLCGVEVKFRLNKHLGIEEPYIEPGVYKTGALKMPVHIVTKGHLGDDFLEALTNPNGRCGQPPFYVWNEAKQAEAALWRKCTKEYKLDMIRRVVASLRDGKPVIQWIGISLDEAHRMKDSGVKYITNYYPLVEARETRNDCEIWIRANGFPMPPKSACRYCPYINNHRLRTMRDTAPKDWQHLRAFDAEMRKRQSAVINGAKITGTLFVHRSCKPIGEVDLSTEEERGPTQYV